MRGLVLAILIVLAPPVGAQGLCRPMAGALVSAGSCAGAERVSVAVVGDVLLHRPLQWRGYARGFETIWGAAVPFLRAADIAVANLEGPTAPGLARGGRRVADPGAVFDDVVYSEYPQFNYHPMVIDALRAAGVGLVSTANNHALDRGPAGLAATMDELDRRGMAFSGSIRAGAPRRFARRVPTRLGALSFIACSYGTNGLADPHRQVLLCHDERASLLAEVRAEAASPGVAGVVVLPHWGQEYSHAPTAAQRALARDLVAAGAIAVIGTHPHVVQPVEVLPGPAGSSLVAYSTGNFVAAQVELPRATGAMVWAEFCPAPGGGLVLAGSGLVSLQMDFAGRDPVLRVPALAPGRALVERLAPGFELSDRLECRAAGPFGQWRPAPRGRRRRAVPVRDGRGLPSQPARCPSRRGRCQPAHVCHGDGRR